MGHKCKCQSIQSGRKNHPFNLLCNGLLTFSDHLLSSAMLRLVPAFSTGALTSGVCQNACLVFVWHGLAKSQSLILKSWIFTMVKSVRSLFFPIVHHILHFFACSGPILFIPPPCFFLWLPASLIGHAGQEQQSQDLNPWDLPGPDLPWSFWKIGLFSGDYPLVN